MSANVIDVADPADPRLDDFRDLNSVDRRPDLPTGKGLVIAEGVLVVQRMLTSRFTAAGHAGHRPASASSPRTWPALTRRTTGWTPR